VLQGLFSPVVWQVSLSGLLYILLTLLSLVFRYRYTLLLFCLLIVSIAFLWRRSGLMVSVPNSGSSGPGLNPGRRHCVVFSGKTLNSNSTSLHPGIFIGTSDLGVTLQWTSIPSRGSRNTPSCFMRQKPG